MPRKLQPPFQYFIDECLGRSVRDAVESALESGEQVHSLADHFDRGTKDEVWLQSVGKRGWVVLTMDGKPVTGATYIALPAGPVVAKYDRRIVQALEDAGLAQQDEADDGVTKPVCLLQEPTRHHLTEAQLALADRIGRWARKTSARALSEYSHKNIGWQIAWDAGLGQSHPAQKVDLRIAMQQVMAQDPWLEEEASGDAETAFAHADAEPGAAW